MSKSRKGTSTDVRNVWSSGVWNERVVQSTTQLEEDATRSSVIVTGLAPNTDAKEPLCEVNLNHQTHPISAFDMVLNIQVNRNPN